METKNGWCNRQRHHQQPSCRMGSAIIKSSISSLSAYRLESIAFFVTMELKTFDRIDISEMTKGTFHITLRLAFDKDSHPERYQVS